MCLGGISLVSYHRLIRFSILCYACCVGPGVLYRSVFHSTKTFNSCYTPNSLNIEEGGDPLAILDTAPESPKENFSNLQLIFLQSKCLKRIFKTDRLRLYGEGAPCAVVKVEIIRDSLKSDVCGRRRVRDR